MDVSRALDILRTAVAGSSQVRISRQLGVGNATVSRWLSGEGKPTGEAAEKLLRWAGTHGAPAEPPPIIPAAIVDQARRELAETHRDLARIYGYAESIADLAETVAKKQRGLLTMLQPWVEVETDVKAGKAADVLRALAAIDAQLAQDGDATPSAPADAPPAAPRPARRKSR